MRFLITDYFYKSITKDKTNGILKKIYFFYEKFKEKNGDFSSFPKGYWIKKIQGIENLYEFRVNNGDRVFFTYDKNGYNSERRVVFLLFSKHDMGVKKAKRKEGYSVDEFIKFNEKNEVIFYDENYVKYNDIVLYEIIEDKMFVENFNNRKYKYYYLNNEQYSCLEKNTPYFVAGSAGSGKSTITLRKVLNLEEFFDFYEIDEIIYLTSNDYLKDNSQNQYEEFRRVGVEKRVIFKTIKEFFREKLGINKNKIVSYKEFENFLRYSFPNFKRYDLSVEEIYSEINGIIKGLMFKNKPDNWNRDITQSGINKNEYLNLSSKYSILSEDKKNTLYSIYEKYSEWLKENDYFDLNDIARLALNNKYKVKSFIVLDEIQDLTELEIFSLFNFAKDHFSLFLAGDIHQMINRTFFSFERIKALFYTKYNYSLEIKTLKKNYRSCKKIVELSNYFSDLRSEYIGNLGIEDYKENSIQKDGEVILTKKNLGLIKDAQKDVSYAIVVADEKMKESLYEELENKHRIFTIQEIKGLEYQNIICYNLSTAFLNEWKTIFEKKARKDQRFRKYFNIFYVGITRAQEKLIIMEDNINNFLLEKLRDFLEVKENIEIKHEKKTILIEKKDWLEEGIKLYKLEKIDEAQYAFEKAGDPEWILKYEIEKAIETFEFEYAIEKISKLKETNKRMFYLKKIIDSAIDSGFYIQAMRFNKEFNISYKEKRIKICIELNVEKNSYSDKELLEIKEYFYPKREYSLIGKIYYNLKKYTKALEFFELSGDIKYIKKGRLKLLEKKYGKENKKIYKILEVEEKGINNFGKKDGLTPLQRCLVKDQDIEFFEMLLYLGANLRFQIKKKFPLWKYCVIKMRMEWNILERYFDLFIKHNISFKNIDVLDIYLERPKLFKNFMKKNYFKKDDNIIKYIQQTENIGLKRFEREYKLLKQIIKNKMG